MPKIKIAHLYYDLMNLYGENANIRALVHFAERQGIKAEVSTLTIGDEIDFSKYDIIYGGLSSITVLLIWIYALCFILVLGIVINTLKYNK